MSQASEKFIRLSHLHKLRRCEQVAAVCYRKGGRGIEFLLVQTRGGRWTFPKGSTEPGLTHAQAAALEAFEEAGVHGRIEEASFTRYACGEINIHAHLCEVLRLDPPQEFGRTPTWFSAGAAKRRFREARKPEYAAELCGVVDRAGKRIERQESVAFREPSAGGAGRDALQQVRFEACRPDIEPAFRGHVRREIRRIEPEGDEAGRRILRRATILQLAAPREPDESTPAVKAKRR